LKGKIIKGIAGSYHVHTQEKLRIYECKAKGIFRYQSIKPLVGDDVEINTDDQPEGFGTIINVLPRKNELIRPAVANVDQAMVIFAAAEPEPNLNLLDRFLIMMQRQGLSTVICFNKTDKVKEDRLSHLKDTYKNCGSRLILMSLLTNEGLDGLQNILQGKTTVLAGPSGVGKSTLINRLSPTVKMETGDISRKIKRGKHTTRHSELIYIAEDTYIMDTPGFSSLYIDELDKEELKDYFPEFNDHQDKCRFIGCNHRSEPGCAVKEALARNEISRTRYDNYITLYEELENIKRY
jgi:ribosome biogenesis GTPase